MDVGDQLFHGQSRRHTHCAGQWQSSRRGPSTHDSSNEALLILSGLLWLYKLKLLERFLLALLSRGRAKKTIEASQEPSSFSVPPIRELLDLEAELTPVSSSEVMAAGVIYAPYIPLYQTPTLNISDLNIPGSILNSDKGEEIFTIKKYDDIYSNINNRFELLDL